MWVQMSDKYEGRMHSHYVIAIETMPGKLSKLS